MKKPRLRTEAKPRQICGGQEKDDQPRIQNVGENPVFHKRTRRSLPKTTMVAQCSRRSSDPQPRTDAFYEQSCSLWLESFRAPQLEASVRCLLMVTRSTNGRSLCRKKCAGIWPKIKRRIGIGGDAPHVVREPQIKSGWQSESSGARQSITSSAFA